MPTADIALSPTESVNVNKRKAPDSNSGEEEEVLCPCGAGPCALLTSNKPVSQGRKFYRCPKPKVFGGTWNPEVTTGLDTNTAK